MKKLKTLTAAATVGLVAFATTSAKAADFTWTDAAGDKLWSTPGNWVNTDEKGIPSTKLPTSSDMVYCQTEIDQQTVDNTMTLTEDVSIDKFASYAPSVNITGNGHNMTIANGNNYGQEYFATDLTFSGTNSVLTCNSANNEKYRFRAPAENGLWAKDGASIVFATGVPITLTTGAKFKATNGGKVTLPGAAMAEATNLEADGADSAVTFPNTTSGNKTSGYLSLPKDSTIKAVNGGKVTLNSVRPNKTTGQVIDVMSNGVLVVNGILSLGNDGNTSALNIAGAKPEGGFVQIRDASSTTSQIGCGTSITLTPELDWADGTDIGLIHYYSNKYGKGTFWDDVTYNVDLINFQNMSDYETKRICICHTDGKSGSEAIKPGSEYRHLYNNEGLYAYFSQSDDKKSLYLTVYKHNWSPWEVVKAPTKHSEGKRVRHCTDAGCTKVHEESIAKLEHDYLQIDQANTKAESDAAGYFQTAYTPHLKNTTVELVASPSTNHFGRSLILAGTEEGNFMYIFANCQADSGAKSLHAYVSDVDGGVENFSAGYEGVEPRMTYTFGGGKFTVNGVTTSMTNTVKDVYANTTLAFFKHTDYQWTGGVRVYSIKVTEKVEGVDVVKMWLVPGMNGAQATLLDLVSGEYLKPTNAKNFYLGDDPVSGFMMYLR